MSSIQAYFNIPTIEKISADYFPTDERFDSCLTTNDYNVAIIGVEQSLNSIDNKSCDKAPNEIRKQLYALRGNFKKLKICDLGNLAKSKNLKENYLALQSIVAELTEKNIICIILGGSQELTVPIFNGIKENKKNINLSIIDSKIDLGSDKHDFNSHAFITPLLKEKSLRRMEVIGYQSYFVPESQIDFLKKHNQYGMRLGVLRKNIQLTEPILRDSDIVSVDMSAIRQADAPAYCYANPNGLLAEDVCQLSLYSGYSDRMKAFGVFELNPDFDHNNQSAALAAQMIWHFLEGLNNRQEDYPLRNTDTYQKYIVQQDLTDGNVVFYNNEINNRWWIEIPNNKGEKEIYACDIQEYEAAKAGKIPEMWLKYFKR
jgi:arginase family enzyme